VKTASDPSLGVILVDAEGKTLYTLTNGDQAVACTGGCLTAWPPLLLPAGTTTATGAAGVTDLGTTPAGSDQQVTQAGLPLYRFAADTAAGDANGEGITSFGGTWHVVKVSGTAASSSTSTTKKSRPGY
jgi:predicted lipoprotein with Yx(FWY)xxD motif